MIKAKEMKVLIFNKVKEIIEDKIETAKKAIESAKESRNNDTKSSAGDKYETGRAMMQIELEKNEAQLSKALNLKKELNQINIQKEYERVELGSFVMTNHGNYFISIGLGKLEVNGENYYSISLASPIGKLLQNKITSDTIQFKDREITIKSIL